ncbi:GDP/UDP-N,N'-diacetylbacillosamine 2-epimerase (hydrolyzing) [Flavobacterium sp. W4I14]|nr:GDP/UDP-N,N'-diacetylbacillosamine 2-epimerase (hydrolyzing) [Flavobacterium sp. W4I14]
MEICIATGTRAEYGLLKPLIEAIKNEPTWSLKLLVTGAHLSPEFGLTYKEIEQDGLHIDAKVEMLLSSDTAGGIVKSMGIGMIGYADALKNLAPTLLVILGDRYEMLALASAALIFKIPIIHIHGGEITEGAYDDAIRHAITKMSHLHFTSTEAYRQRVIQLGEQPKYVFNVGAIGLDNIRKIKFLNRLELEEILNIKFLKYNYQVTFHPATLSNVSVAEQFEELLQAIKNQEDSFFVFTKANADTDGRVINQMIDQYVSLNPNTSVAFSSLGTLKFLSLVKECDAIIGNSSSGIIEAPSLKTVTINIGDRQKGRIQADSVINCDPNAEDITKAIRLSKAKNESTLMDELKNPYGIGQTASQIVNAIKSVDWNSYILKSFYNLN